MDHDLVAGLPLGDSLADLPDDPGGVGAADVMAVLRVVAVSEDRDRLAERRPDVVEVDALRPSPARSPQRRPARAPRSPRAGRRRWARPRVPGGSPRRPSSRAALRAARRASIRRSHLRPRVSFGSFDGPRNPNSRAPVSGSCPIARLPSWVDMEASEKPQLPLDGTREGTVRVLEDRIVVEALTIADRDTARVVRERAETGKPPAETVRQVDRDRRPGTRARGDQRRGRLRQGGVRQAPAEMAEKLVGMIDSGNETPRRGDSKELRSRPSGHRAASDQGDAGPLRGGAA